MINIQSKKLMSAIAAFLIAIGPAITVYANETSNRDMSAKPAVSSTANSVKTGNNSATFQAIIAHGKKEYNNHCLKCHTDQVFTRKNHFIKSLDALKKRVVRCKNANNILWFDKDTNAVVQYLNQKYYKFK